MQIGWGLGCLAPERRYGGKGSRNRLPGQAVSARTGRAMIWFARTVPSIALLQQPCAEKGIEEPVFPFVEEEQAVRDERLQRARRRRGGRQFGPGKEVRGKHLAPAMLRDGDERLELEAREPPRLRLERAAFLREDVVERPLERVVPEGFPRLGHVPDGGAELLDVAGRPVREREDPVHERSVRLATPVREPPEKERGKVVVGHRPHGQRQGRLEERARRIREDVRDVGPDAPGKDEARVLQELDAAAEHREKLVGAFDLPDVLELVEDDEEPAFLREFSDERHHVLHRTRILGRARVDGDDGRAVRGVDGKRRPEPREEPERLARYGRSVAEPRGRRRDPVADIRGRPDVQQVYVEHPPLLQGGERRVDEGGLSHPALPDENDVLAVPDVPHERILQRGPRTERLARHHAAVFEWFHSIASNRRRYYAVSAKSASEI